MAAGLSAAVTIKPFRSFHPSPKPRLVFNPLLRLPQLTHGARKETRLSICFVLEEQKYVEPQTVVNLVEEGSGCEDVGNKQILIPPHVAEKLARKKSERFTYLVAAVMSSFGITSMAIMAVYYRFSWQMEVHFLLPFSSLSLFNTTIKLLNKVVSCFFFFVREEKCPCLKCSAHLPYLLAPP